MTTMQITILSIQHPTQDVVSFLCSVVWEGETFIVPLECDTYEVVEADDANTFDAYIINQVCAYLYAKETLSEYENYVITADLVNDIKPHREVLAA